MPQQTGVPLKQTQHMQPDFMQAIMQSQQAWIMSQQALSPLVQVMHTPLAVISQAQLHIAMLHWHMTMPFFIQQQLHMPSQSILHMFCSVAQDISSSHSHIIFIPPAHFSIFIVQRGVMVMLPMFGMEAGMVPIDIGPGIEPIDMLGRSVIIGINIADLLSGDAAKNGRLVCRNAGRSFWCFQTRTPIRLIFESFPLTGERQMFPTREYSTLVRIYASAYWVKI